MWGRFQLGTDKLGPHTDDLWHFSRAIQNGMAARGAKQHVRLVGMAYGHRPGWRRTPHGGIHYRVMAAGGCNLLELMSFWGIERPQADKAGSRAQADIGKRL